MWNDGNMRGKCRRFSSRAGLLCLLGLQALAGAGESPPVPPKEAPVLLPAQGAGHGVASKPYDPREYTIEQRERIEKLFLRIICDCPRENWSKTLAGCPEGCAEPQKKRIRELVKAGKTDEEVLEDQLGSHGGDRRVLAEPDSLLATYFPYIALGALCAAVLFILFASVKKRGAVPAPAPSGERPAADVPSEDERIARAVEKDLREMDL